MNKFDICSFLEHVYLFQGLAREDLEKVTSKSTLKRYKRNSSIFEEGEAASSFFIMVHGKASVYRVSPSGVEQIIHLYGDHDIIAEAAIFDKKKYPASCKTLEESLIVKVPKDEFVEMILENPEISLKILAAYSKRLRGFVRTVEILSFEKVEQRILKYFEYNKVWKDDRFVVKKTSSKKELAQFLGTIPETLSRNLKRLKDSGKIRELDEFFEILK